ncbi:hypothetical protein [Cellulomonas fimi]|uniref:Uncharacterized protein n=1 Tax=Cellulomonas fimi TaxID=1708 RepID=A0A7Y0LXS8_CELFI|nr:hypothetical protein [Cellulomonas fimi]NMR20020.1 hypothetical protein [Cellulomonas fimi]
MTLLQKAVTPEQTRAYLVGGHDRVAGYVVRAVDVSFAVTPAQLVDVHALAYPHSPFRADSPWIDVLRFESAPQFQYRDGALGTLIPEWWLRHSRLTPGAELVRVFDDGSAALLGRYADIGSGWRVVHAAAPRPSRAPLSRCVGPVARWHGGYLDADLVDGGRSVVFALDSPPLLETGFRQTRAGRWSRRVPREEVSELFELDITAWWFGMPVRIVDQWQDRRRDVIARISALADDEALVTSLRMDKVEAGVYETTVPLAELNGLVTEQLVPEAWATVSRLGA